MIAFDCRLQRRDFVLDAAFEAGGGVTALFGVSGSGKTTALRVLAGLERPERGRIAVDDAVLVDTARGVFVPACRRRMGMVFQDAQLFPHLSVRQNLEYGRWFTPAAERRVAFAPVVEVLGIAHLLERQPATLSGGERQRVAIGRALLASPRLLLMDEPLAALDADRRLEVLPLIERVRDAFGIPILYVSHAAEEVARLGADGAGQFDFGFPFAAVTAEDDELVAVEQIRQLRRIHFAQMHIVADVHFEIGQDRIADFAVQAAHLGFDIFGFADIAADSPRLF